jgi:threonine dehydrogenase-like Zn-dependent dehydrogenase
MKALVYTGPKTLEFMDQPDPIPGEGERVIRIEASGICGSDMHAFLGHDNRRPAPLILGHEACGTICDGPNAGQRVTINPLVTCGTCRFCMQGRDNLCINRQIISMAPRPGAFAQFVAMPERNLVPVPDGISSEKAALAEPLAVSWHAVKLGCAQVADVTASSALVIGGGAIGLAAVLALKAQGFENIVLVEPNTIRRDFLRDICPAEVMPEAKGEFTMVVDAVGYSATRAIASAHAAPGGVIVHIGLGEDTGGLDIRRMTLQEITFVGTYTYTADDFRQTAAAMFDGRLGPLDWIELRPLSSGAAAFDDIRNGRVPSPKIVLTP